MSNYCWKWVLYVTLRHNTHCPFLLFHSDLIVLVSLHILHVYCLLDVLSERLSSGLVSQRFKLFSATCELFSAHWKSIMLAILCPLCCFGSSFKEISFCTAFSRNFSSDFLVVFPMCELCSACWPASVPLLAMKLGWRSLAFDQSFLPFFPKNHSIKADHSSCAS